MARKFTSAFLILFGFVCFRFAVIVLVLPWCLRGSIFLVFLAFGVFGPDSFVPPLAPFFCRMAISVVGGGGCRRPHFSSVPLGGEAVQVS